MAKSFFSEREGRAATVAMVAGSVFPDSDLIPTFFTRDNIALIENHRGFTHSLITLPVFALLLGGLTVLLLRQRGKWLLYSGLYGIGIGLHILLDLFTPYGTMIFSPLSNARYSWDILFIVDVVFTTLLVLPQLMAWVYSDANRWRNRAISVWLCLSACGVLIARLTAKVQVYISGSAVAAASILIAIALWGPSPDGRGFEWRRSTFCRAGLAAIAIYVGLCAMAHRAALTRVEEFGKLNGAVPGGVAAIPAPPSLWQWSGLVKQPKGIYRGAIDLTASGYPVYSFFPNAEDNRDVQAAEARADMQTFLWFARFPWITYQQNQDGTGIVEMKDIQFLWPPRGNRHPFTFHVSFDGQGHVLQSVLER